MILNEQNGAPSSVSPASAAEFPEPGPVWYTPNPKSVHANGGPIAARLLRSCGSTAWIALLQPGGRWKRVQAAFARLAPRLKVLDLDETWVADLGFSGGTFPGGAPEARGGLVGGIPAHAPPSATSPRAGLSIAAEPGAAPLPGQARASDAALQCPDCGATAGRRGQKFREPHSLRHHQTMAHPELFPSIKPRAPHPKKNKPRTAPARPPSDASDLLQCPDCGATSGRTGRKFHRIRDLLRHQDVAHRLPDPAAGPIECPDCGATVSRRGTKFRDSRDLALHRAMVHRAPDPAAGPLQCPDCGATSSKRGTKFRDSHDLAQHRKWCARLAAKAAPLAEASPPAAYQNVADPAPAPVAAPKNGSAAHPAQAHRVCFCAGCGLNLQIFNGPILFCPKCGLNIEAIYAALRLLPGNQT